MRDEAKTWWLFSGPNVASSYFFKRKSVSHLNHEPSFGYRCYRQRLLTNTDNIVESAFMVTDITDHMPNVLVSNINSKEKSQPKQNAVYKKRHTDDNINVFKSNLSKTNWAIPLLRT